mmetsp:Transcript_24566/g.62002  ORF Transcript_24566/g.62002 Transcript_24566/m.62002 type:complete len:293 (+) Transcript_24566:107-985(+)
MGGKLGKEKKLFDSEVDTSVETAIALGISPSGVETIQEEGKAPNIAPKSGWHSSKAAVKISPTEVLVLGWNGVHKIDLQKGTQSKYSNEEYHLISAVICTSLGSPGAPPKLVTLSGTGLKHIDLSNGGFAKKKIAGTYWDGSNVRTVLHHPKSGRTVVLTVTGTYSLNLDDGKNEKLSKGSSWSTANCGVVYPDGAFAMIFGEMGQYKMSMEDGSYESVGSECWPRALDAVLNKDGSACLVFNENSIYRVDLATGQQTKVHGNSWHYLKSVCRLGLDAGVGTRIHEDNAGRS